VGAEQPVLARENKLCGRAACRSPIESPAFSHRDAETFAQVLRSASERRMIRDEQERAALPDPVAHRVAFLFGESRHAGILACRVALSAFAMTSTSMPAKAPFSNFSFEAFTVYPSFASRSAKGLYWPEAV